jgi:hypothetical protein
MPKSITCFCYCCFVVLTALVFPTSSLGAASVVGFGSDGTCQVNGKPFFPIGIWVYSLDPAIMADLHEHRFNTIVGQGFKAADLPLIEKHGMMCVPMATDEFVEAARNSASLLAWYLIDEPEEHGTSPEEVARLYKTLKEKEPTHPIGITHCQLIGPGKYIGSCDFTMTDVYPVTRDRDWPLKAVGQYTAGPRKVHGPYWPNFTFIQTFGGPETDGGIWAQPLPSEVRFMAFNALVHRANGILYFSYWPRAQNTWAAIAKLNRDIEQIVPWLIAPGEERTILSDNPAVEIRARKTAGGWICIATNTEPKSCDAVFKLEGLGSTELRSPYENRTILVQNDQWREHFAAYEERVYLHGVEPEWP